MSPAAVRVALLRSPREFQSFSMDGYADSLRAALRALNSGVETAEIRPRRSRLTESLHRRRIRLRIVDYWRRYPSYMRYVRELDFELAHVLDQAYGHLTYALGGSRTVVTCHDIFPVKRHLGEIPSLPARYVPPVTVRFSLAGLRRAAAVITSSEATKADLARHVGVEPSRITVIPYGIHPRFRPIDETKLAKTSWRFPLWRSDMRSMLVIDTGGPYKNQRAMLEVLALVRAIQDDVVLIHRGEPFREPERRRARALGVADAVIEIGCVHASDMPLVYNRADVLLFPSHYEGFGWPPLEAMACGTPVVCSRAEAVVEVTGGHALNAEADDHEALAGHVVRILGDNALRNSLAQPGLEWAARYTWARAAKATLDVYREVLEACN